VDVRAVSDLGLRISDLRRGIAERGVAPASAKCAYINPPCAIRNPQAIDLHIDEMVLYGFSPGDRHRIAERVERELGRLLAEQGLSALPAGNIDVEQVDGGSFRLPAGGKAATTGAQIASAVYSAASSVIAPGEPPSAAPAPGGGANS
jgi:hypothetical protein